LPDILIRKQQALDNFKGRDRLMVLVKPTAGSKYRLLIDALDELSWPCFADFSHPPVREYTHRNLSPTIRNTPLFVGS